MKKIKAVVPPVLLICLSAIFSTTAHAHTTLVSSNPSSNQVLESMPSEIVLTFSEDLISIKKQEVNLITLQDAEGTKYELIPSVISSSILSALVGAGDHPAGKYILTYRAVSADGHPVTDKISFFTQSPTKIEPAPTLPLVTDYMTDPEKSESKNTFYIFGGLLTLIFLLVGLQRKRSASVTDSPSKFH